MPDSINPEDLQRAIELIAAASTAEVQEALAALRDEAAQSEGPKESAGRDMTVTLTVDKTSHVHITDEVHVEVNPPAMTASAQIVAPEVLAERVVAGGDDLRWAVSVAVLALLSFSAAYATLAGDPAAAAQALADALLLLMLLTGAP